AQGDRSAALGSLSQLAGLEDLLLTPGRTVAGIGAVGSELVASLAAAGIGHLTLLDPDVMNTENVHRHVLGIEAVGARKAEALAQLLSKRFPHLEITGHAMAFDTWATAHPERLRATDLVVLATGEETDELRINALLAGGPPRLHAWVDPVGLAGHVVLGGVQTPAGVTPGCYACVVVPHATHGFVNRLSLVAPGQQLQRAVAGCAGTFNPFPAAASRRTALEAADLAVAYLTGGVTGARVVTWRARTTPAVALTLSPRARVVLAGTSADLAAVDFARDTCPVCGVGVPGMVRGP
ncbi:MAG: ThiF family adenylyltransferase, partial [Mycolicibacterium frederiksbergense]|nr:ThiF family adenylyltransferase [Mycolicibacterium frederiksbergense]